MFVSPAFSTPTRPMTSPQSSPFTPPTNFNKVSLSVSSAQQQRQGFSFEKGREMRIALQLLRQRTALLSSHTELGLSGRIKFIYQDIIELARWKKLIEYYISCLTENTERIKSQEELRDCEFLGEKNIKQFGHLNLTVPFTQFLQERKENQNFDVTGLIGEFNTLLSEIQAVLEPLEHEASELKATGNSKINEALASLGLPPRSQPAVQP